jgi:hypothetical protein
VPEPWGLPGPASLAGYAVVLVAAALAVGLLRIGVGMGVVVGCGQ